MADVIIVLGSGLDNGKIGTRTKERLLKGIAVFDEKKAPRMLMSGGVKSSVSDETAAEIMKENAVADNVPTDVIFTENNSKDTIGNAVYCALDFCIPQKWKNIIVVTSDFHVPRAKYVFTKVFGCRFTITMVASKSDISPEVMAKAKKDERKLLFYTKIALLLFPSGHPRLIEFFMTLFDPKYRKSS